MPVNDISARYSYLDLMEYESTEVIALSPLLSYRSTVLPQAFNNDPADQIIVATAREENATMLTKDGKILAYENVRSLW